MNRRTESTIGILAALFVLLSAMFDVRVTLVLAIILLNALTSYHALRLRGRHLHRVR